MSILLYLPGLLFKRRGLLSTMAHMAAGHDSVLREDAWAYAESASNLGHVFLYKWTVNWRFEEDVFLSSRFAMALLVGQVTVLMLLGLFKCCRMQ